MLEDAIKQITGIIDIYPDIKEITITSKSRITIFWGKKGLQAVTFKNTVDLLEWCEENLKPKFDDVTPKNMIVSFFYSLIKKR